MPNHPTPPTDFVGTPTLTPAKVETLKTEYLSYLHDKDDAADRNDVNLWAEWACGASAIEWVLRVLYDQPWTQEEVDAMYVVPRSAGQARP